MRSLAATATHHTAALLLARAPMPAELLATGESTATSHIAAWFATTAGLLTLTALITSGYAFTCWIWPFKPCRYCHGTGKRRAPFDIRAVRIHGRCNGTGLRLRFGRRVYEYLRTEQRGTRR
ncbi:hypothetical protein GCM10022223_19040 [Kineosporia mesophila]|uniref:Uncharacterized protein n=1 Tax=Kineosporia mesophila TaxID=566012 RepID=A0ABP6ZAB4_9ACTN|nr:hypothetical protein [Kineosporia mesophila]MCD5353408.1 hypothetical protein [Kineosporia mesophila]